MLQSPYTNVAGGAIATAPGGRCDRTYASEPVDSDICIRHSGSAESAHGASPRQRAGPQLAHAAAAAPAFAGTRA